MRGKPTRGRRKIQMSHDLVNVTAMLHSNEQQRTDNDRDTVKNLLYSRRLLTLWNWRCNCSWLTDKPLIPDQGATQGHEVRSQKYVCFFAVSSQNEVSPLSDCTVMKYTSNCWVNVPLLHIIFKFSISHTRTVVRECKGDDASQRGNWKFDPLPRPNPLTNRHQKLHTWLGPTCKI